jgi:hypothetical protein
MKKITPFLIVLFALLFQNCKKGSQLSRYNNSKIIRPNEIQNLLGIYNCSIHLTGQGGQPYRFFDSTYNANIEFEAVTNQPTQLHCKRYNQILKFNHKDSINGIYYFSSDTFVHSLYVDTFNIKLKTINGRGYSGGLGGYSNENYVGNK